MKSAEKIAKLAAERGLSKPLSTYTSRARSQAAKKRFAVEKSPGGRKPKYSIVLSRNASFAVLREYDAIATERQLYEDAYNKKMIALCWQMREDLKNRLFGKPFVCVNPDAGAKGPVFNDNRLQIAMGLLPNATRNVTQSTQLTDSTSKECGLDTHTTTIDAPAGESSK